MFTEAEIQLGSKIVGKVVLNMEGFCGEGGYRRPTLVFPLTVTIEKNLPGIFVWEWSCTLYFNGRNARLGEATLVNWNYSPQWRAQCRIPLTHSDLSLMEKQRHKTPEGDVWFVLHFDGRVAGSYEAWNSISLQDQQSGIEHPHFPEWEPLGIIQKMAFFSHAQFHEMQVRVPASEWVNRVLPGLGFNRLHLIEVTVPDEGSFLGKADAEKIMRLFNESLENFNLGRYKETVQRCRDIFEEISKSLSREREEEIREDIKTKEGKASKIAETIANVVGWQKDDARIEGLGHCWQALQRLSNRASHRGSTFTSSDARFCLWLVSILLDYLGQLTERLPAV